MSEVQTSYDRLAPEYAARIYGELAHKPFDRELLDRFAESLAGKGPVCDLGCGPGHVARYLHGRGVDAFGIDLSPAMVEQALRQSEALQHTLRALIQDRDRGDHSIGAIWCRHRRSCPTRAQLGSLQFIDDLRSPEPAGAIEGDDFVNLILTGSFSYENTKDSCSRLTMLGNCTVFAGAPPSTPY